MFLGVTLLAAASFAQTPTPQQPSTDCAGALARGIGSAVVQVCLGAEQLKLADSAPSNSADRRRHLETAVEHYRRAADLTPESEAKGRVLDTLARLYDPQHLNEPNQMELVLRELITILPNEGGPLYRLAKLQEDQGFIDVAEATLLSARQRRPDDVEPYRMLAQFYARRAGALHQASTKDKPSESPVSPGQVDEQGVFRVGGSVRPPRRAGNPQYPPEAQAAGIQGVVIAEVLVNEVGAVTEARVVRSIPLLDEAALKAVREWRYDPTMVNGRAVPVRMTVTVNFSLP